MYFQESEDLRDEYPQIDEEIGEIDKFLQSLKPEEELQLNIEYVSDILNINLDTVEHIFNEYSERGLLRRKRMLFCPIENNAIKEINVDQKKLIWVEFCDLCGENHLFKQENVKYRYSLQNFSKKDILTTPIKNDVNKLNKILKKTQVDEISESMRLLNFISNDLNSKPFEGKRLLIILHFLKDLIPFMNCCENLGLNPNETILFYKDYLYPHKEAIINYLIDKGYSVCSKNSLEKVLLNFQDKCRKEPKPVLVIEDGGYIVPIVHKSNYSFLRSQILGAVEQTTKGERRDFKIDDLNFPVISVAGSDLKNTYEPPHIGRTVVNNIQRLLNDINFSSKNALVIGYGSIGKSIAHNLRNNLNMTVTVTDNNADKLLIATQDGIKVNDHLKSAVKNKSLIIGATGETSINMPELSNMINNVYLVSASSDQVEIGLKQLESLQTHKEPIKEEKNIGTKYTIRGSKNIINLVCNGFPINFCADESMPNEASDLIMTLILLSTVEIVNEHLEMGCKIDSKIVNDIAKNNDVSSKYHDLYILNE